MSNEVYKNILQWREGNSREDFHETSENFKKFLNFKKMTKILNTMLYLIEYGKVWSIGNTTGKS